ncbi:hypothetical protein [Bacillus altitudinis]|uniref:hypothetical protein n=1 Tax=Bacillus altitudinis TaxID=293387 RepID=UPI00210142CF|nr:hypothetical protein [Bacillus altitudinis]UTV34897.1 hypothetical protein NM966_19625 [Bacillus altitudinis]
MKTFFEIIEGKHYRQLTTTQKEEIQNRQTDLVLKWQDASDRLSKDIIFDELFASINGLIKGMAFRQAERSFSVEQEDFEGIMYLTLVETLLNFDRTLGKPFQPIFIMNVKNEIKMMYRQKGYDLHEETLTTSSRLDSPSPSDATVTMGDALEDKHSAPSDVETFLAVEQVIKNTFGEDEKKRTIVHMSIQNFKRNEIVSAIAVSGQSPDAVAKQVNRTVKQFKDAYVALT